MNAQFCLPLSRATDPASSHAAADEIRPHVEDQESLVGRFLLLHPFTTARELASYYAARHKCDGEKMFAMFHKRLPGLRAKGKAINGELRQCRISGRLSQTWKST